MLGGPCAGKTSALNNIKKYFSQKNYRVFIIPEVATMLFTHGIEFGDLENPQFSGTFQRAVFR